ncbi:MAG TPA: STAS domain-containing protein [Acidimicrobiales bacterium]|nr:STAS domain-containing protein [Acidimicrobiales bacterium]
MTLVRPPEFSCLASVDHREAVVAVNGELDMATAPELSQSLAGVLDQHPRRLTLELGGLEFIDSTGLTLLVRTSKELKEHEGALELAHPTPPVRRVLEIVGLDGLLVA